MTRISFFFLIRQDDICQLPVRELSGQRDCKSIHFLKPFQGEAPSTPKVIRTNVGLKQAHTASTETALVVAQSVLSHLEDTQAVVSFHSSKWTALLMFGPWLYTSFRLGPHMPLTAPCGWVQRQTPSNVSGTRGQVDRCINQF